MANLGNTIINGELAVNGSIRENGNAMATQSQVNAKYTKPSAGIPKTDLASAVQTSLGKADTALQSYTETDPTVPDWAKTASKPSYQASEIGGLATVATSGSYNDLTDKPSIPDISGKQDKLTAGSNITISNNTISATVPTNYVTTNTEQTITSKKTFNGEVKFGNTENFQGYYIKRMLGSLGAGTRYADLDSSYKDGTWHRMWRLRFPSSSSFWGKIKITLYGGYSSFNASGVMSKSITCNFNAGNIYNNVGCYDGLGVNVEQDFRISEAIWNATASAWEVLIWQNNLSGNNSPTIMLECWTTNNTNYINAFNGITAQTVELTQSTSYSAQKASPTGGTKTVTWAALPVYENPLGEEIATTGDIPKISFSNGVLTITTT